MYFDLFIASLLFALGAMIFGRFEEGTPLWRRLLKLAAFLAITALISRTLGQPWSLIWIIDMFGVGIAFHVWWTTSHGIEVFRPAPRDRYYQLRGWR